MDAVHDWGTTPIDTDPRGFHSAACMAPVCAVYLSSAEPAEAVMWDRFTFPTGLRDVPRHVYTYFPAYPAVPAGPVFCPGLPWTAMPSTPPH